VFHPGKFKASSGSHPGKVLPNSGFGFHPGKFKPNFCSYPGKVYAKLGFNSW